MSKWIIVYTAQKTTLATVEICDGLEYEISDYDRASRQDFWSKDEADKYCIELAHRHNLKLDRDIELFLD